MLSDINPISHGGHLTLFKPQSIWNSLLQSRYDFYLKIWNFSLKSLTLEISLEFNPICQLSILDLNSISHTDHLPLLNQQTIWMSILQT